MHALITYDWNNAQFTENRTNTLVSADWTNWTGPLLDNAPITTETIGLNNNI